MIKTDDLFKDKPFPKWMISHPIFKDVKKISKVFPGIGLPNCNGECSVDNGGTASKSAKNLIDQMKFLLSNRAANIKTYKKDHKNIAPARQAKLDKCFDLMTQIKKKIVKGKKDFISINNGRVVLTMPNDFSIDGEDRPTFRKGERLFSVYNKLSDMLVDCQLNTLTKLDTLQEFKTFSTDNVPNNKFKIVFSSDGTDGAWDIATMSMRGVQSCQSWEGGYSKCLIGSVIDPFVGIIYLTSDSKTKYGSKMIKRCVVRFAINEETHKPFLFLDNMYPNYDVKIMDAFKEFLSNKLQKKFDVVANTDHSKVNDIDKAYMPLSGVRKRLVEPHKDEEDNADFGYDDSNIASYQDTHIKNKEVSNKNDKHSHLYNKNSKKKEKRFIKNFSTEMMAALKASKKDLPDAIKTKKIDEYYAKYGLENAGKIIAKEIAKSVDRDSFTNSNLYLRRLYCSYFNNKNTALNTVKTKVAKEIKTALGIKNFKAPQLANVMSVITPKIDAAMKEQLKELIGKKKKIKILPLP